MDYVCNHGHQHIGRTAAVECNENTTHLRRGARGACGARTMNALYRENPKLVTCKRCVSTGAFKQAIGVQ